MPISYKPDGYTSLAPYLIVDNAARTIDFLIAVFGATRLRSHQNPDGRLRHAEVRIDDTVLMLADSLEGWDAVPSHVHIYVPDVDATYQRAIEAGATPVQAPLKKDGRGQARRLQRRWRHDLVGGHEGRMNGPANRHTGASGFQR
ncbi:MAG: VOC family protein [Aquabacterium sp.]